MHTETTPTLATIAQELRDQADEFYAQITDPRHGPMTDDEALFANGYELERAFEGFAGAPPAA
jgi:hypothetical protein